MIYAIRAGESGPIKFGVAGNPEARLAELQTGNPEKLELIAYAAVHHQNEKLIHFYLRDERLCGEWFRPTERTLEVVVALKGQAFSRDHVLKDFIYERELAAVAWFRRMFLGFALFEDEIDRARAEGIEFRSDEVRPNRIPA